MRLRGGITQRVMVNVICRHSFFIIFAFLLLTFIEDRLILSQPASVNIWYIFFEVISAYANVGLSVPLPNKSYSLSGDFHPIGKVLIVLLMILGKSRMLPRMRDPFIDTQYADFKRKADLSIAVNVPSLLSSAQALARGRRAATLPTTL